MPLTIFQFNSPMHKNSVHDQVSRPPQCVGFIMDGNRRWATEQQLDTLAGHKAGEGVFYKVAQYIKDLGIPHAVFYAFSTENWSRQPAEVAYLNELFYEFVERMLSEIHERQVGIRVIGDLHKFSPTLVEKINELETVSAAYTETTIWVALSYGGRAEIIAAVNEAVRRGDVVTEESLSALLWSAGMPDPDLIIRSGGEVRLSNFLPWQSVYSELMFTPTYWPAFTKEEFLRMLEEYGNRQRRHGK